MYQNYKRKETHYISLLLFASRMNLPQRDGIEQLDTCLPALPWTCSVRASSPQTAIHFGL